MSSSTLTAPPARVAGPVRLTRRGRVVLVALFLACVLGLMVAFGGLATATRSAGDPADVRIVEVQPGDTLYGLAADYAAPGDIREKVHEIRKLNGVDSVLQPGTQLAIPLDN